MTVWKSPPHFVLFECSTSLILRSIAGSFFALLHKLEVGLKFSSVASCVLFLSVHPALSQSDTIRIQSYNVLNYPGSTSSIRNPYFRTVIGQIDPDILVVQEMVSNSGLIQFKSQVLNFATPGLYDSVTFNDGPDSDNGLFYKSAAFSFVSASYIPTALRNIAEYVLLHNGSGEQIRIYSVHLKASQGFENERYQEALILRNHLNALPSGTNFIVTGDFNIYESTEPAFSKLTGSEADDDGRCFDPLNLIGDWGNASFAPYHTQSPRLNNNFAGGATGGLDDRFDMFLRSASLQDNLLLSSYTAYGNDGNHYNDSINRMPNTAVDLATANALHYASDHLPVFVDLVLSSGVAPTAATTAATSINQTNARLNSQVNPNGLSTSILFEWGPTVALGDSTVAQNIGSGTSTIAPFAALNDLAPNTTYFYRVLATNVAGTTIGSTVNFTTVPLAPSPPTLVFPANGDTNISTSPALSWNPASTATSYRIQVATDSLFGNIVAEDSTVTDTVFSVGPLSIVSDYFWRVQAKNTGGTGAFSNVSSFRTEGMVYSYPIADEWNLVSLPVEVTNNVKTIIFPTATSQAFKFNTSSGYTAQDTLTEGVGYWIKFDQAQTVEIAGYQVNTDSIQMTAGWNLMGMISLPVPVSTIASDPPGIVASLFFAYGGSYADVDTLFPGNAYWVKTSSAGTLFLNPSAPLIRPPSEMLKR